MVVRDAGPRGIARSGVAVFQVMGPTLKQVGMIAHRDFEYRRRQYTKGDRFEASAIDAAILKRAQHARLTTPQDGEPPAPPPPPQVKHMESAPPKPKRPRKPRTRKTNRRDIPHAPVTK